MRSIFIFFLLFTGVESRAGLLIEPYGGYQSLVTSYTFGSDLLNGSAKLDTTGTMFGLRVGATLSRFFGALDISAGTLRSSLKELTPGLQVSNLTSDLDRASIAITLGVDLALLRPYAGYIVSDAINFGTIYSGTGQKVGVGIALLPKLNIHLNLEYQTVKYTKSLNSANIETTLANSEYIKELSASGYFAYVSIPFEINLK